MELKLSLIQKGTEHNEVLIVPYGIETLLNRLIIQRSLRVLIVPYGIETALHPSV